MNDVTVSFEDGLFHIDLRDEAGMEARFSLDKASALSVAMKLSQAMLRAGAESGPPDPRDMSLLRTSNPPFTISVNPDGTLCLAIRVEGFPAFEFVYAREMAEQLMEGVRAVLDAMPRPRGMMN